MKKHEIEQQKIFLIKNTEGKFINVEDPKKPYFTEKLWLGSYASIKGKKGFDKNVEYLNNLGIYGKLSVHETTIYEHLASSASEISSAVIILDLAAKKIKTARDRIPNITDVNINLRKSLMNTSGKLKFVSPIFEGCCANNDDFTFENQGNYESAIDKLSQIDIWNMGEVAELLEAYINNGKSMIGSARRVNKKQKENGI